MNDHFKIDEIKLEFKNSVFSSSDLYNFYLQNEPTLNISTFRWRVHKLKEKNTIYSPKRGFFAVNNKKTFSPTIDKELSFIFTMLKRKFPYTNFCIWRTAWLNDYMVHQPLTNNIIVEIEKEAVTAAFSLLQVTTSNNVFLNPSMKEMDLYVIGGLENIIIKKLNSSVNVKLFSPLILKVSVSDN